MYLLNLLKRDFLLSKTLVNFRSDLQRRRLTDLAERHRDSYILALAKAGKSLLIWELCCLGYGDEERGNIISFSPYIAFWPVNLMLLKIWVHLHRALPPTRYSLHRKVASWRSGQPGSVLLNLRGYLWCNLGYGVGLVVRKHIPRYSNNSFTTISRCLSPRGCRGAKAYCFTCVSSSRNLFFIYTTTIYPITIAFALSEKEKKEVCLSFHIYSDASIVSE